MPVAEFPILKRVVNFIYEGQISFGSYRVIQRDCRLQFFSDGPKTFQKCNNPMIFRELIQGGFGILMFQKCHVCGILPFEAFPIKSICFTIQRQNTQKHPSI